MQTSFKISKYQQTNLGDGTPSQTPAFLPFGHDFEVKVTWNVTQSPLHHVSYVPAKFEVTTSNCLGTDVFTRNTIFGLSIKVT